jgi:hypothetical protein
MMFSSFQVLDSLVYLVVQTCNFSCPIMFFLVQKIKHKALFLLSHGTLCSYFSTSDPQFFIGKFGKFCKKIGMI